jgi:DNA-binding transcriptional MerR regulator
MSDEPLFMLRELADQLALPESTVRYYRDAFLDHIPSVGTGRRRRYPPAAFAVLRSIARGYSAGLPRAEVLKRIEGAAPIAGPIASAPDPAPRTSRRPPASETTEVTNLDLLAAIVDGERQQREALWQMAQEVVRLTQVLENQEKVLAEISDHTGITLSAPAPRPVLSGHVSPPPALGEGSLPGGTSTPLTAVPPPPPPPPMPAPAVESPPSPSSSGMPTWLQDLAPPPAAVAAVLESQPEPELPPVPLPPAAEALAAPDIERLRQELETERALVDRLREAKLKLEQRTTDAEGALAEHRGRRRGSVISRLLNSDRDDG